MLYNCIGFKVMILLENVKVIFNYLPFVSDIITLIIKYFQLYLFIYCLKI